MVQQVLLHDGSFEGFLTAVALAVKSQKNIRGICAAEDYVPELFVDRVDVASDGQQAMRLVRYLGQVSPKAAHLAMQVWLSEDRSAGNLLYGFVRLCLARGSAALSLHSNDTVRSLHTISKKVSFEAHRLTGMLRFRILADGLQYAPFTSDHNVIGHCGLHFKQRFGNRRWMLHDVGRRFALYYDGKSLQPVEVDEQWCLHVEKEGELPASQLTDREEYYQNLWRRFHRVIANPDRENKLLQRSFMPRRYWHFMFEMKESGI